MRRIVNDPFLDMAWLARMIALAIIAAVIIGYLLRPTYSQERTYTWTLTSAEVSYIGALLDEQKVKDAAKLVAKLQSQITQQDQALQQSTIETFRKQTREQFEAEARAKAEAKESQP